ncbi:MAG: recombination protein RecR [Clostridia bacterium]|nr:recombination protein RecR [Clostridia bacterium]
MGYGLPALEELVESFRKIKGVGRKSAERMAFEVLNFSDEKAEAFAASIVNAKKKIKKCSNCFNFSEGEVCPVCSDPERDRSTVCVVEDARTVFALENVRNYKGTYHVLEGAISPLEGKGPAQLRIKELLERINNENIGEVIVATNSTAEGETTAMYLAKLISPLGVKVTRLAYGIPFGGELDHADEITLSRAIEGRREIN